MNTGTLNATSSQKETIRRPWLAGLLSIVHPGFGHIYAGNLSKGLLLIVLPYIAVIIAWLFLDLTVPVMYYAMIACGVAYFVYSITSSILLARKNRQYRLKKYNHWFVYVFLYSIFLTVRTVFPTFGKELIGFDSYRIVSGSMHPTLKVGDLITVDTRHTEPKVGDVVVFPLPVNPVHTYTFRVAAVGGDVISINKGIVTRNGVVEEYLIPIEDENEFARQKSFAETTIPNGEIMVLGDYRARSNDSRYWGFVKASDVIGKVRYVWFSKDRTRIGKKIHQ